MGGAFMLSLWRSAVTPSAPWACTEVGSTENLGSPASRWRRQKPVSLHVLASATRAVAVKVAAVAVAVVAMVVVAAAAVAAAVVVVVAADVMEAAVVVVVAATVAVVVGVAVPAAAVVAVAEAVAVASSDLNLERSTASTCVVASRAMAAASRRAMAP